MLKAYVRRETPADHGRIDYEFASRPEDALCWETKEEAENACVHFNRRHIMIPSSEGGTYACSRFRVEEEAPGKFVVFCIGPFIISRGESPTSAGCA